jgi:hypothetical protein
MFGYLTSRMPPFKPRRAKLGTCAITCLTSKVVSNLQQGVNETLSLGMFSRSGEERGELGYWEIVVRPSDNGRGQAELSNRMLYRPHTLYMTHIISRNVLISFAVNFQNVCIVPLGLLEAVRRRQPKVFVRYACAVCSSHKYTRRLHQGASP